MKTIATEDGITKDGEIFLLNKKIEQMKMDFVLALSHIRNLEMIKGQNQSDIFYKSQARDFLKLHPVNISEEKADEEALDKALNDCFVNSGMLPRASEEALKEIKIYIKENTDFCKCKKCGSVIEVYMDKDSYDFYCLNHLKEMLLEDDAEILTEFLRGGDCEY